jgi:nucleotide-binding universal stress UspA family protein
MFRSILVPLDGTPQSAAALPPACAIVRASGGTLHLLHVVSGGDEQLITAANVRLDPIRNELCEAGFSIDTDVRRGETANEIIAAARELEVDLIVMATRTKGSRSMVALTSVSRAVVSRSPTPVLLVRPGAIRTDHLRTLLVPVDGSPGGSLALAAAVALARAMPARIVLLQVVVPLNAQEVSSLPGVTLGGFIDPAWGNLAIASSEDYVDKLADHLAAGGLVCEAHVAVGEVAQEIVRCSEDFGADIVIMSTHSRTWPGDALHSSVALEVLGHGLHPVLLVQRESLSSEVTADDATFGDWAANVAGAAQS